MTPVLEAERKPEPPETVTTTFRCSKALVEEIDAAASELDLSRNKAITQLLRYALNAHRKGPKKARK